MKQDQLERGLVRRREKAMSDYIWETFDGLFKTVYQQKKQIEELEARIIELEKRLSERERVLKPTKLESTMEHIPVEKAA
jgi:hypothetical protein